MVKKQVINQINKAFDKFEDNVVNKLLEKIASKAEYNQQKDVFEISYDGLEKFKPKTKEKGRIDSRIIKVIIFLSGIVAVLVYISIMKTLGFQIC